MGGVFDAVVREFENPEVTTVTGEGGEHVGVDLGAGLVGDVYVQEGGISEENLTQLPVWNLLAVRDDQFLQMLHTRGRESRVRGHPVVNQSIVSRSILVASVT